MFPWSVMPTAGWPSAAAVATTSVIRAAPSSIEYSVCRWRCTNDLAQRRPPPRSTAVSRPVPQARCRQAPVDESHACNSRPYAADRTRSASRRPSAAASAAGTCISAAVSEPWRRAQLRLAGQRRVDEPDRLAGGEHDVADPAARSADAGSGPSQPSSSSSLAAGAPTRRSPCELASPPRAARPRRPGARGGSGTGRRPRTRRPVASSAPRLEPAARDRGAPGRGRR